MKPLSAMIALAALLVSLGTLRADDGASSEKNSSTEPMAEKLNVPAPTAGGMQFWSDLLVYDDWRLQRHALTGHCRLLDAENRRRAWGTFDQCRHEFDRLKQELKLPMVRGKVVLTLHGLGRTRSSMSGLGRYLAESGGYTWVNVSYASTRQGIEQHAQALAGIVEGLGEVEEINFVAHSLGNLVIRHYLADGAAAGKTTAPRLGRIVMLAPPNNGTALAGRLKGNALFRAVVGVSGKELADQWPTLQKRLATPVCPFGIIAGGRNGSLLTNPLLTADNDLIVTVDETRLVGARDFLVVPAMHTFIMDDPHVRKCTLTFLKHGYFISDEKRQPIVAPSKPDK